MYSGGIYVIVTKTVKIENTDFIDNTAKVLKSAALTVIVFDKIEIYSSNFTGN